MSDHYRNFNVITRCSRLHLLPKVKESVFKKGYNVTWHLIFDCNKLKNIDTNILKEISGANTRMYFVESNDGDYLYPQSNIAIESIPKDEYICFIDDDNILHPSYYYQMTENIDDEHKIFVVDQYVNGKDFTGLQYRVASPENNRYQGVDIAQLTFHKSVFNTYTFDGGYAADGYFVELLMRTHQDWFKYINITLSYYNYLSK